MCQRLLNLFVVVTLVLAGAPACLAGEPAPKYVFLMIGDGMGAGQRATAERYKQGKEGKPLLMNQFPMKGTIITSSYGKHNKNKTYSLADATEITDSAAAGTALACGVKTTNRTVGMLPDHKTKARSIAYDAQAAGMKVGIVTSVFIDHATPGAFYANQPSRGGWYGIACQLPPSRFDYFAGEPGKSNDPNRNKFGPFLEVLAKKAGYTCLDGRTGLTHSFEKGEKILWQTPVGHAFYREDGAVPLATLVEKGIQHLDNDNGFFMMVEAGRIDGACHHHELVTSIHNTLAFDKAVAVAYEFYKKHPKETLIIVTADHETGGLALDPTATRSPKQFAAIIDKQRVTPPAFNETVKDWKEKGITTEQAFAIVAKDFGLTELNADEQAALNDVFSLALGLKSLSDIKLIYSREHKLGRRLDPVTATCHKLRDKRCGVTFSTYGHTSVPVPTTAVGTSAKQFGGDIDNTEIAKRLRALITTTARVAPNQNVAGEMKRKEEY